MRVCFEDHCPFDQIVRAQRGIKSIRIAFEHRIPNHSSSAADRSEVDGSGNRNCQAVHRSGQEQITPPHDGDVQVHCQCHNE